MEAALEMLESLQYLNILLSTVTMVIVIIIMSDGRY